MQDIELDTRVGSLKSEESKSLNKSTHKADNECLGDFGRGRTHMTAILVGEVS